MKKSLSSLHIETWPVLLQVRCSLTLHNGHDFVSQNESLGVGTWVIDYEKMWVAI